MAREAGTLAACNFAAKAAISAFTPSHRAWLEAVALHAASMLSSSVMSFIRLALFILLIKEWCFLTTSLLAYTMMSSEGGVMLQTGP